MENKSQQVAAKLCDKLSVPRAVSEVTKERLRRVAKTLKSLTLEAGFRVLKIDTSNMKDVYYAPDDVKQDQFEMLSDNIKEERTSEDLSLIHI